jgi:hypothetical protein
MGSTWTWYEGGCASGASVGQGASITITPASAGTHDYFVRAEGACGNTNCVSVSIDVYNAPPTATIHYTSSFTDGCVGAPANVLSVNAVSNAVFYRWTSAQAGVRFNGNPGPYETTVPTVNITFVSLPAAGTSGWSICVFGGNACGNTNNICAWVRAVLSTPTAINGSVIGCPSSTGNPYSVPTIAGAASYLWSSSAGITINNNGSSSITVDFAAGFVSGTLTVLGQTSCGYNGAARTITIARAPGIPGSITGPSYPCPNATSSYSVSPVTGAANYTWTTSVPGAIVIGNTNTCNIQFPASIPGGSSVTVVANSSCPFASSPRAKGIASGIPSTPSVINGPASGECGQSGVSYSIAPVAQATGYNWATTCGSIVGPNNLSAISIDWPANFTSCIVTVSANNSCGTGGVRSLTVLSAPGIPATITGNAAPCANGVEIYNTSGSTGATGYIWTVPAGATILGPSNGASILVQWGTTGGNITVKANNSCGNSGLRSLPCTISCRMSQANSSGGMNTEVYPNPVVEKATIKFTSKSAGDIRLSIVDLMGREIFSDTKACIKGINIVELDLNTVAKGVYLLNLENGDEKEVTRIAVE